jgi:hypothetical protein
MQETNSILNYDTTFFWISLRRLGAENLGNLTGFRKGRSAKNGIGN